MLVVLNIFVIVYVVGECMIEVVSGLFVLWLMSVVVLLVFMREWF